MLDIDFVQEVEVSEQTIELVTSVLQHATKEENITELSEVCVTFTTNSGIQQINKTYRNKDMPTDVISFAMEELGEDEIEIISDEMPRVLGDIIISIERAKEQADEYGHSETREIAFLALHGFLHLLGYDHMEDADEVEMTARQQQILTSLGITRDA